MDIVKLLLFVMLLSFLNEIKAQNTPLRSFEGYYLSQDIYPNPAKTVDWFPDDWEVQGVTNDGSFWYFTIVDQAAVLFDEPTEGTLWKIPKTADLDGNVGGVPGTLSVNLFDEGLEELQAIDAWHWGDPDHMRYQEIDYIIVPINSIVACFRASDLSYVNYAEFDNNVSGGWCAVGVDNKIYASENNPTQVTSYDVDWDKLTDQNDQQHDALLNPLSYELTDIDGTSLYLTDMQGGEFSNTGELLFLVSGRGRCLGNGAEWSERDGIHAIRTDTWKRVEQSVESNSASEYFNYEYNPDCVECGLVFPPFVHPAGTDTPEGLTVWKLDDDVAPNISGSLHVLIDRYLIGIPGSIGCKDKLYFHHYSSKVIVNPDEVTGVLRGTRQQPFASFNEAFFNYPIWAGAEIILKQGNYSDTGIYNQRVLITSEGGSAIIGQ